MTKHTPGPLRANRLGGLVGGPLREFTNGCAQGQIAMCMHDGTVTSTPEEIAANASRLALCWNTHDELVGLLSNIVAEGERQMDDDEGQHFVEVSKNDIRAGRKLLTKIAAK